ncbi:CCR4-associated factor 1, putative [Plasmodium ovale]|uniref:poly(A)-specific ribonuclease n=2 Tax=Plasmodium ovale TaxID=36330 RepID=A0A1A8X0Q9_PLAOA|nr:CCR4-associated factor 1, putative (CAF1) [Plasmodium ovale curtisi]SBS98185.1 CCR4-associated factor 1, putative (CAF1) [Plasmodium ovale curtisi]SCQ16921.1 CCR4-associated factor 1, putative [Plasmodium ovale]
MDERTKIVDVWANNLEEEFERIRDVVENHPYVAIDTEFPGIVARPTGNVVDYNYQTIKCNVDLLKVIQLGVTFSNGKGELPKVSTWQFNFKFDLDSDMYAQNSIDFLKLSGINFEKHQSLGIELLHFGEVIMSSGLVMNEDVKWISFHGCYDFAYLLKILTCSALPHNEIAFFDLLNDFFPSLYDIKYLLLNLNIKQLSRTYSLQKISEILSVKRIGRQHQAGSDSLVTCKTFFRLMELYFDNKIDDNKYSGIIYGLGTTIKNYNPKFDDSSHKFNSTGNCYYGNSNYVKNGTHGGGGGGHFALGGHSIGDSVNDSGNDGTHEGNRDTINDMNNDMNDSGNLYLEGKNSLLSTLSNGSLGNYIENKEYAIAFSKDAVKGHIKSDMLHSLYADMNQSGYSTVPNVVGHMGIINSSVNNFSTNKYTSQVINSVGKSGRISQGNASYVNGKGNDNNNSADGGGEYNGNSSECVNYSSSCGKLNLDNSKLGNSIFNDMPKKVSANNICNDFSNISGDRLKGSHGNSMCSNMTNSNVNLMGISGSNGGGIQSGGVSPNGSLILGSVNGIGCVSGVSGVSSVSGNANLKNMNSIGSMNIMGNQGSSIPINGLNGNMNMSNSVYGELRNIGGVPSSNAGSLQGNSGNCGFGVGNTNEATHGRKDSTAKTSNSDESVATIGKGTYDSNSGIMGRSHPLGGMALGNVAVGNLPGGGNNIYLSSINHNYSNTHNNNIFLNNVNMNTYNIANNGCNQMGNNGNSHSYHPIPGKYNSVSNFGASVNHVNEKGITEHGDMDKRTVDGMTGSNHSVNGSSINGGGGSGNNKGSMSKSTVNRMSASHISFNKNMLSNYAGGNTGLKGNQKNGSGVMNELPNSGIQSSNLSSKSNEFNSSSFDNINLLSQNMNAMREDIFKEDKNGNCNLNKNAIANMNIKPPPHHPPPPPPPPPSSGHHSGNSNSSDAAAKNSAFVKSASSSSMSNINSASINNIVNILSSNEAKICNINNGHGNNYAPNSGMAKHSINMGNLSNCNMSGNNKLNYVHMNSLNFTNNINKNGIANGNGASNANSQGASNHANSVHAYSSNGLPNKSLADSSDVRNCLNFNRNNTSNSNKNCKSFSAMGNANNNTSEKGCKNGGHSGHVISGGHTTHGMHVLHGGKNNGMSDNSSNNESNIMSHGKDNNRGNNAAGIKIINNDCVKGGNYGNNYSGGGKNGKSSSKGGGKNNKNNKNKNKNNTDGGSGSNSGSNNTSGKNGNSHNIHGTHNTHVGGNDISLGSYVGSINVVGKNRSNDKNSGDGIFGNIVECSSNSYNMVSHRKNGNRNMSNITKEEEENSKGVNTSQHPTDDKKNVTMDRNMYNSNFLNNTNYFKSDSMKMYNRGGATAAGGGGYGKNSSHQLLMKNNFHNNICENENMMHGLSSGNGMNSSDTFDVKGGSSNCHSGGNSNVEMNEEVGYHSSVKNNKSMNNFSDVLHNKIGNFGMVNLGRINSISNTFKSNMGSNTSGNNNSINDNMGMNMSGSTTNFINRKMSKENLNMTNHSITNNININNYYLNSDNSYGKLNINHSNINNTSNFLFSSNGEGGGGSGPIGANVRGCAGSMIPNESCYNSFTESISDKLTKKSFNEKNNNIPASIYSEKKEDSNINHSYNENNFADKNTFTEKYGSFESAKDSMYGYPNYDFKGKDRNFFYDS